jgi:hypothetical protein
VITTEEAATLAVAHDLTAKVIRVDDFAQDLGASEMRPPAVNVAPAIVVDRNREAA